MSTENTAATTQSTANAPVKVSVKGIKELQNQGMKRSEIRKHLNLSHGAMKQLFSDPRLKNTKALRGTGFILVEDGEEDSTSTAQSTSASQSAQSTQSTGITKNVEGNEVEALPKVEDGVQATGNGFN